MRPENLKTKIFLDSGDPNETREVIEVLGFLDGQTTNPTLVAKNPYAQERFKNGEKFSKEEIFIFYKKVITEISELIPNGSVSIEVYADKDTTVEEMFAQGKEMFGWIPNAHIKYPITSVGLEIAEKSIKENMRVNMTLNFTEDQAGAVYDATKGAKKGDVFISPFIGRLDDKGEDGITLVRNIRDAYKKGDGHVEILSASVRTMEHFLNSLVVGADIITAPLGILEEWAKMGMPIPNGELKNSQNLREIKYKEIDLNKSWKDCDITHELTEKGIERFAIDWNNLIKNE